jgi:hypothetical protein
VRAQHTREQAQRGARIPGVKGTCGRLEAAKAASLNAHVFAGLRDVDTKPPQAIERGPAVAPAGKSMKS